MVAGPFFHSKAKDRIEEDMHVNSLHGDKGPSIKYVTLEGVREGVTVCDRRGGPRACDVTLLIEFHTYKT